MCGERPSPQARGEGAEQDNKKAGLLPAASSPNPRPGRSEAPPGQRKRSSRYFFFAFLAFFAFAFFAFFAFLAIVSSQGLMVKRDTRDARRRASLATSSTTNSADSRASAPRCHIRVIALSTAQMRSRVLLAGQPASPECLTIRQCARHS